MVQYNNSNLTAPAINWPTPDNKASDYAWVSPYSFCAGNPIAHKELNGDEWKVVNDDDNRPYAFEWVDSKNAYGDDGKILPDHYVTAILFSAEGAKKEYNPKSGHNMGFSLCTVMSVH